MLRERCAERGTNYIFIESLCDDPAVLEENIKLKLQNSDYKDVDPTVARVSQINESKDDESDVHHGMNSLK